MMLAHKRRPRKLLPLPLGVAVLTSPGKTPADDAVIRNDRYALALRDDHSVEVRVEGLAPQVLTPRFTVMYSERRPGKDICDGKLLIPTEGG